VWWQGERGKTIVTAALPGRVLPVHGTHVRGLGSMMLSLRVDERKGIDTQADGDPENMKNIQG